MGTRLFECCEIHKEGFNINQKYLLGPESGRCEFCLIIGQCEYWKNRSLLTIFGIKQNEKLN